MIQIAIWGIALMLVVKGLDVMHQQLIAQKSSNSGSQWLALLTFGIAIVGAAALVKVAQMQAISSPIPDLGTP